MNSDVPIRILIADDHPVVRGGLAAILNLEPGLEVVGEAASGEQAIGEYRRLLPDVVLMDLRMEGIGGIAAIRAIRAASADARVVVFSSSVADEEVHRAIAAGALGYVSKHAPASELIAAIRAARRGERTLGAAASAALAGRDADRDLTPREQEVLDLIVAGKSNTEIGKSLGIARETAKVHVKRILAKLGVEDRAQAVSAAVRRGIVNVPQ